jgi:hypothetical protein
MKNQIMTPEFMQSMAGLFSEALQSPDGMKALAAAIAGPIEQEIKRTEITSLLLTRHVLPLGEPARYQKRAKVKAYWISRNGEAMASDVDGDEVEFPIHRIHAMPMIDISTLKHGNIGSLTDIQKAAAEQIRKEIDKRTLAVISAAVPAANTVTITGGKLTEEGLNEAMTILEDQELNLKYIVLRGGRFNDLRGWDLDPQTDKELFDKGVIKIYGGANILRTSAMDATEVLLLPDEEIGKWPIREQLKTDTIEEKKRFKTGWLTWMEVGHGVTRPEITAKLVIQP